MEDMLCIAAMVIVLFFLAAAFGGKKIALIVLVFGMVLICIFSVPVWF